MEMRPAKITDLDAVIGLTRRQRHRLAEWCPTYFNPRQGSDEAHASWIEILLSSEDHDTRVLVDNSEIVGFYHLITQPTRRWVDDLCIADDLLWPHMLLSLEAVERPWVTCAAVADHARSGRRFDKSTVASERSSVRG